MQRISFVAGYSNHMIGMTLFLAGLLLFSEASHGQEKKKTIAVIDFRAVSGLQQSEASILTQQFEDHLVQSAKYRVIQRHEVNRILIEQAISNDDLSSAREAAVVGKILAVDLIVNGTIGKIGNTWTANIGLIEVNTGEVIKAGSENCQGPIDTLLAIIRDIADSFTIFGKETDERATLDTKSDWHEDTTPPSITILSPTVSRAMKVKHKDKVIRIKGRAEDASGVFEVLVNGVEATMTDGDGFYADIKLAVGVNKIVVRATDVRNNVAAENFTVVREAETENVVTGRSPFVSGKYFALVIGIDRYSGEWMPLKNAVHDARGVEEALRNEYRFDEIISLFDEQATRSAILTKFEWLTDHLKEEDNLLIYYSGHGDLKKNLNKGYWVPYDAKDQSIVNYISNSDIQTFLNGINTRHTLLVSDACFSGDIFRGKTESYPFENTERYFQEVYKRKSRQALTSGGIEPVMDGGREGHSVFTYYFLKALKSNQNEMLDAGQLFEALKLPVANNSEQTPILQAIKNTGDEAGQFIFVRKKK